MKRKNFIKILLLGSLVMGCNQKNQAEENVKIEKNITLTQEELKELKDDNLKAQLLVRKAVLNEMSKSNFTEEQTEKLNELKQNLEIEFFLEVQASKKIQIKDYEVLELYKENLDKLKNASVVEVFPQLQKSLFIQKLAEGKKEAINSIIEEYKLNDELKKYSTTISESKVETTEKTSEVEEKE